MISDHDLEGYVRFATSYQPQSSVDEDDDISPTTVASSTTSYTPDPHAVSGVEAKCYYTGLHSAPTLLYRTGKEQWSPPRGPEAYPRLKELREVFNHPIVKVWNLGVGWKIVDVLDAHTVG